MTERPKSRRGGARPGTGPKSPLERRWQIEVGRRYEALLQLRNNRVDTTGLSRKHKEYIDKEYAAATRRTVRLLRNGDLSLSDIKEHSPLREISKELYGDPDAPLVLPKKFVRSVGKAGSQQQNKLLDQVIADVRRSFRDASGEGIVLTREQVRHYHKLYKKVLSEVEELKAWLAEPPSEP